MIKIYKINGRKYRFQEGEQPEGAVLVGAKVKMVVPQVKIVIPETKEEAIVETEDKPKRTRKSTKKG